MLRIRLCGGFEIESEGRRLGPGALPGRQGRLVLAYLICARPRPATRDELAELLWPGRLPESWPTSLSAVLSKLRRSLSEAGLDGAAALSSVSSGYRLDLPADVWIDWDAAQRAVEQAERAVASAAPEDAIASATEALQIADRGFLPDQCEWVDAQNDAARDLCLRALMATSEAQLLAGAPVRAAEAARDLVSRDPGREVGYRLLMRALAASGERAEALRVWERCRAALVEELGVDPSEETEAVYLEVLGAAASPGTSPGLPSGVVTFVLTDIVGSSALWERHPNAMASALERHDSLIAEVVAAHGGTLLKAKLEGDATVSVFERATAGTMAALGLRQAMGTEEWPEGVVPEVRMAVHTGEAVERDGDYFGPALNRAARLRALGGAGQILLSQAVAELVIDHLPTGVRLEGLGHRDLRGLSRGENVFELLDGRGDDVSKEGGASDELLRGRPPVPVTLRVSTPFVGRAEELKRITVEFDRAVSDRPRAVLLAGEPGVGKSRLASQWASAAHERGALVLHGRCDEGLGSPLQPFVECLRQLASFLDPARLASVQGIEDLARLVPDLGGAGHPLTVGRGADPDSEQHAVFDALVRVLEQSAANGPVVLVLDDLHWAGKTTLLALRHLLRHATGVPLFVLGTYRSTELGRTHPLAATIADLHRDGTADDLNVSGLTPVEVTEYLRAVGRDDGALGAALADVTAGNPFFLIETLRHVEESGGTWERGSLPHGVREAIGRRLSRLSDGANEVLTVAAVTGPVFPLELVEQICGRELVDEITEALDAGLVAEEDGAVGRFRFAHALIRQVLLAELVTLKRVRLHRTIAELLEATDDGDPDVRLTDLAHHWFECAAAGESARAVAACQRAADRAMERLAFAEAAELYEMAVEAHPTTDGGDEVARLLVCQCEALLSAGDAIAARAAIESLQRSGAGSARWTSWHVVLDGELAVVADPDRLPALMPVLPEAAEELERAGDTRGAASAHFVHARTLERLGRIGDAEHALDRALGAARSCGDRRLIDAVLAAAPEAALWGPSPVSRASGKCLDVVRMLRSTGGAPAVEVVALRCQAVLEALRGRIDAARTMVTTARRIATDLGLAQHGLETDVMGALIELMAGEPDRAEHILDQARRSLRDRGLDAEAARAAALLCRALLAQGRVPEAQAMGDEAAQLAGADVRAGVEAGIALALAAAAAGDRIRALGLAQAAVDRASGTDALLLEVNARLALADVLRMVGDESGADAETERATAACERKGATALVAITRGRGEARPPDPSSSAARETTGWERLERNVATRTAVDPMDEFFNHRNLEPYLAATRPDARVYDLRSGRARAEYGVDEQVAQLQWNFENTTLRGSTVVVATRGELHLLSKQRFTGTWEDSGETVLELLSVVEADASQRVARAALFDAEDLDRAYATLDEWYDETRDPSLPQGLHWQLKGDGTFYVDAAWDDLLAACAPHLEFEDHRLTGHGVVRGREAVFERIRSMREGLASVEVRTVHLRECSRGSLALVAMTGTVDAGAGDATAFETVIVSESEFDSSGLLVRWDIYDEYQLDEALSRYDVIASPVPWARLEHNLAHGCTKVVEERFNQRDADGIATAIAGATTYDHRSGRAQAEYGVDEQLRALGWSFENATLHQRSKVIATRGDRLILNEIHYRGSWGSSGDSELSLLCVSEVDAEGLAVRGALFDADDLDAAYETLDAWYGEIRELDRPSMHLTLPWRAYFDPSSDAEVESFFAPEMQFHDHRLLGHAGIESREALFQLARAMRRDLSDVALRNTHVREGPHASLSVARMTGAVEITPGETASFETAFVVVEEYDSTGSICRWDLYEEGQLAEALAHYDDLSDQADRAVATISPPGWRPLDMTAVTRMVQAFNDRNIEAYLELTSPNLRVLDRRRGHQADYGRDEQLAQLRYNFEHTTLTMTSNIFATRGEQLSLAEQRLTGTWASSGRVELPLLGLTESDPVEGALRVALFDVDDLDSAFAMLDAWYEDSRDPAWPSRLRTILGGAGRYRDGSLDALREGFASSCSFTDHRVAGFGHHASIDDYFKLLRTLRDQLTDVDVRTLHILECPQGVIEVVSVKGVMDAADGAQASFDDQRVQVFETDASGLVSRWNLYDITQLDEALAHFDTFANTST